MTLVWVERTCKTMLLGAECRAKLSPRLSPTSRRHGDKNLVDRSDFVRARAVAFDENRLRAQIVAYQQLRDIEGGRVVGLALGGVMVAARRDTVG